MTPDISTWQKTKEAALIGFLGLASGGVLKLLVDVSELKTTVAVYQAQMSALRDDHGRLAREFEQHVRDDRDRLQLLARK